MKRRYLFIYDKHLTPSTTLYFVWLGDTLTDRTIRRKLEELADTDTNAYFALWSTEQRDFVTLIAKSFGVAYSELRFRHILESRAAKNLPRLATFKT